MRDPSRFDLRGELQCGMDVEIDTNVIIEGSVSIGDNVVIGTGCVIKDCEIDTTLSVRPYMQSKVRQFGEDRTVGPFTRLRPGAGYKVTICM